MEHPYLFFVKLFEFIGLSHFAHAYPHVIYTWVVMIILIVFGAIAAKGISMIPGKGQNFFEILISGLEEFLLAQLKISLEIGERNGYTDHKSWYRQLLYH